MGRTRSAGNYVLRSGIEQAAGRGLADRYFLRELGGPPIAPALVYGARCRVAADAAGARDVLDDDRNGIGSGSGPLHSATALLGHLRKRYFSVGPIAIH